MALPFYKFITILENDLSNFEIILKNESNRKHPLVFDTSELDPENQRKIIGHIEDFYSKQNKSHRFPYPIYILTILSRNSSNLSLISSIKQLPHFYHFQNLKCSEAEKKMLKANDLIQQEIINTDTQDVERNLKLFSRSHKRIALLEAERNCYQTLLKKIARGTDE